MWESNPPAGGTPPEPPAAEPPPTPGPKMVPETDLMAVKAQKERVDREVQTLKGQLDTAQREGTATKVQLETIQAELDKAKETVQEVEQLRSQAAAAEESRNRLNDRLATSLRTDLVSKYGYKAEDVKDYKLEQLELLTEALAKAPVGQSPTRRFSAGGNGAGTGAPLTGRAKILAGYEAGEGRRVRGGNNE
jgi:vacuolar-type H+-ATPase subunit I/STV1